MFQDEIDDQALRDAGLFNRVGFDGTKDLIRR
jgi:hypothetical protein